MADGPPGHAAGGRVVSRREGRPARRGRLWGFTLLEILVALAVCGIAMTLVSGIFLFQRRSLDLQAEAARMQRSLSAAMKSLETDLRRAGSGLPPGVVMRVPADLSGLRGLAMVSGLGLADGGSSGPDRLYVAHLSSPPTRLVQDMRDPWGDLHVAEGNGWNAGDLAVVFDSRDADIFRVGQVGEDGRLAQRRPGAAGAGLSKAYGAGAYVAGASFAGYRIEEGSDEARPALVRTAVVAGGEARSVSVADDIEDLQVRLVLRGEERDGDRLSGDLSALEGAFGVRVHLTARSGRAVPGWSEGPTPRWNRTDVSALAPYRDHRRRGMEGSFTFRNRGIGP
jgi:prepilin-type N-terminal cleavage/methylation domain-containing protein